MRFSSGRHTSNSSSGGLRLPEDVPDFQLDPDKGAFVASFGAKGSGKSELNKRLFMAYPYDGLLIDHPGDADAEHRWTEPLPRELLALLPEIDELSRAEDIDDAGLDAMAAQIEEAWRGGEPRYRKYRYRPNFLADNWLERTDRIIGLAYVKGKTCVLLDEAGKALPANATPKFTRTGLEVGRHRKLAMLMPGPRPTGIDPLGLSQPVVITIHSPLHQLDVKRLARAFDMSEVELGSELHQLGEYEYAAKFKTDPRLHIYPPLPPPRPGQ